MVSSRFLQDLGFGGYFFPIKSLIEKVLKNWYFLLPASSWFWWLLFSWLNSNSKTIEELFFQLLAWRHFFHNYVFPICKGKYYFKEYWTIVSSKFRQDLGFGGCFFPIKSLIEKVLKNWYFLLPASSWFWWLLFSWLNSNSKTIEDVFSSFWHDDIFSIIIFFPFVRANITSKSTKQLFLPDSGKILVLVAAFFLLKV